MNACHELLKVELRWQSSTPGEVSEDYVLETLRRKEGKRENKRKIIGNLLTLKKKTNALAFLLCARNDPSFSNFH